MDYRDSGQPFHTRASRPNLFQRAGNHFQSTTVSALIDLLPIIVPVAVITYVVNLVDSMIIPILTMAVREISGERLTLPQFWGLGLVVALLVCYLVGLTASFRRSAGISFALPSGSWSGYRWSAALST